ncbi:MAG: threonylcarbamoyl-AMP synthase [Lachnospiraceae bacterium]|nr:threonylcarbamoyl-AMP synthase [Lachnospiraceae bacterium]
MTTLLTVNPEHLETADAKRAIALAGDILKNGGLVAFPTETVYGLGGNAFDPHASEKIYAAKGRPSDNPLIVHIAEMDDLERVAAEIPEEARLLAESFWPGPLTMILKKRPELPDETTGGLSTVAVRFPSHPVAQAVIAAGGGFIAAPSANASGRPSPTLASHCAEDLDGRVDLILDGGPVGIGVESSIVDLTEERPVILRPGYITGAMLKRILGDVDTDPAILPREGPEDASFRPKAPGMKYRHYAPRGTMTLVEGDDDEVAAYICDRAKEAQEAGRRVAVIASAETASRYGELPVYLAGRRQVPDEVARNLFRILRQCDEDRAEEIYAETFHEGELSAAIMNRMEKASGHRIVRVPSGYRDNRKEHEYDNSIGE